MRTRRHAILSVGLIIGASLLVRACESPTGPKPVAAVTVAPGAPTLHPTQTTQLTATVLDAAGDALTGRAITWTTSNSAAATVNGTGLVTAVAVGTATITATAGGIPGTSTVTVTAVPVDSVSVAPATANVIIGQTRQLVATPRDSVGAALAGRVVTWGSSDLARATVSATGLVTAVGLGPVTITATSEGINGTAVMTVVPVPVDSVAVAPTAATRLVGLTAQFTATTLDSINNVLAGRVVTWGSSNNTVATVNASGLATALTAGTVTITATSEGVNGTATFTVTNVPVDSVWVQPDSAIRFVGQTTQFTAVTYDSIGGVLGGRVVTWQTSNAAVATMSAAGLATGVAPGTATITATSEGVSDTAYIRVSAVPVDSVAVTPAAATRYPSQTVQLSAATLDSAGGTLTDRTVTWASSNEAVATVNGSGLVTAVAVGVTTITATSEGVEGTATITVVAVPVDSVEVTPAVATRYPGQTVQLTAATFDSVGGALAGRVVTWASSNESTATVDSDGLVTAVAVGVATITATSEGVDGTATITVEAVPVDSVAVTPPSATRYPGQTVQLTAATFDSAGGTLAGRVVTWASSNEAAATVDAAGLVTTVAVGVTTITATSEGINGTATITIVAVPVSSVEVSPDSAEIEDNQTAQFTAVTRDSAGGVLAGRVVTWSSLDPSVASVSASGLATGLDAGLARIVATSEGKADTARLSVTAPAAPGAQVVGPFDISVTADREDIQSVASDGTNALFVLQRETGPAAGTVLHYTLVDSTGAALVGVTSMGFKGDPPAVAFGDGVYLAASALFDNTDGIHGWLISQAGAPLVSAFPISVDDGERGVCGLAYAGGTFVIIYQKRIAENPGFDSLSAIYGRTVSAAGTVGAEFAVSESYADCDFALNNALASNGTGFLAVWDLVDPATNKTSRAAQARTISSSGVVGAIHTIYDVAVDARLLTVAARAGGGWVAGFGDLLNEATANFDASVQLLAADGSISGGLIVIETGEVSVVPTVGDWESGFSVLLIERPALASDQALKMHFYTAAGTPSGSALTLGGVDGVGKVPISLGFDGNGRFFVAAAYFTPGSTLIDYDFNSGDVRGFWVRR